MRKIFRDDAMQKINYQDISRFKEHRDKIRKEIQKESEGGIESIAIAHL